MSSAAPNPAPLEPEEFAALADVSRETLRRLCAYEALLRQWSAHINLVAASTLADPWRRHFLDSAQLFPLIPPGADSLVDLGSGAGFPGLVLAIIGMPGVTLVEADGRKCAFLREAARVTGATVTIHHARIDSLPRATFAVVTARGLAPLNRLLPWAERFIGPATVCLFPKGREAAQELLADNKMWDMEVATYASLSDPRGVILRLSQVRRRDAAVR
jgi:16S rRNA (guanine527-N7)-methyltransferase